MRVLCLGEAVVDLVCEEPVSGLEQAARFVPHFGGMAANVAVVAARGGAEVALAGGAGDDAWGRWLQSRLDAEGVALEWFELVAGSDTAIAFVTVDGDCEPSFQVYADGLAANFAHLDPVAAVDSCGALFVGSNTLVGETERALTHAARERALATGRPLVFDPNLRLGRWPSAADAAAACRELLAGCFLVKCNAAEAELLTGAAGAADAAEALVAAGARLAVVTCGAAGALLRGAARADIAGVPAASVSTLGAGDTVAGVLLAHLAREQFDPAALEGALPEAVAAAARSTEHWGALA